MKETYLQNVDLSSEVIVFDQQNHQGQLIIKNIHNSLGSVFKIKATKLNIIDVKPAKGFIKPQSKVVINFKLSANLSFQQMEATEKNDKFLVQILNVPNQQASREEVQGFWKAYKNNTANLQHGYGCYRVFMNLTGKKITSSNIKSQTMNSKMYNTAMKTSNVLTMRNGEQSKFDQKKSQQNDQQLSKKYTDLKRKQQQLRQMRENIFKPALKGQKGSKIKTIIVLLLIFMLAFMGGNYARSKMIKVKHHQKVKQQKKSFFNFFNS